ncbi:hypothetical protein N7454_000676 [Penicillium verhagenii]|nr:hypothetical protein N7454_000676 [Penicillium verhagenii]
MFARALRKRNRKKFELFELFEHFEDERYRSDESGSLLGINVKPYYGKTYNERSASTIWMNQIIVFHDDMDPELPLGAVFDLDVAADDPYVDRCFILGRSLLKDPLSEKGVTIMHEFLKSCKKDHREMCTLPSLTQLPVRLVDVGHPDKQDIPCLLESEDEFLGAYTALSYCWGGISYHQTTTENIRQRKKAIDFDSLPRTIQDSIRVTKVLGFRYIWIDSLCIIQDDRDDWERQALNMASIFQNAQVTIIAARANSSDEGFLQLRDTRKSCAIPWNREGIKKKTPQVWMTEHAQSWIELNSTSRVATRGWTFQERILAPRSLVFGKDQMYWECNACVKCENNVLPIANDALSWVSTAIRTKSQKHDIYNEDAAVVDLLKDSESVGKWKRPSIFFDQSVPARGLVKKFKNWKPGRYDTTPDLYENSMLAEWSETVEGYSDRKLTVPSDKLPAISGIMLNLWNKHKRQQGDYVAGMWTKHIEELSGLLWKVDADVKDVKIPKDKYRAPSWSWAKIDGKIEPMNRLRILLGTDPEYKAEIVSIRAEGSFIGFEYAEILISGLCGYLDRKLFFPLPPEDTPMPNHPLANLEIDSGKRGREEQLRWVDNRNPYAIRIAEWISRGKDNDSDQLHISRFLVLLPVPGRQDTYTRWGMGEAPFLRPLSPDDTSPFLQAFTKRGYGTMKSWDRLWHDLEFRTIKLV